MMRINLRRMAEADDEEVEEIEEIEGAGWRARLAAWMARHPKDAVALFMAVSASAAIMINALFLQSGPRSAPLLSLRAVLTRGAAHHDPLPRRRPVANTATSTEPSNSHSELVADIQRALIRRKFYDGAVDGIFGPKTESAVRDFAQAAHLQLGAEPSEAMLKSITISRVRDTVMADASAHGRSDPIAELLGSTRRVVAVQRALSDFGYGQIKPTGVVGPDTVAAIEKFERARELPVTGKVSDRLVRELSAVTGRPLE